MTKGKQLAAFKARRNELANNIREAMALPDSEEKFKKLIKATKLYKSLIDDMNLEGFPAKVWPATFETKRWVEAQAEFTKAKKERCIKAYRAVKEKNLTYTITLCWTIKPDYCVCESIVNKLQKYFASLNIPSIDRVSTEFPDRVEFCETYKLIGTEEKYELIMKSAEYILDITADSIYDKCNIGLFGKKLV